MIPVTLLVRDPLQRAGLAAMLAAAPRLVLAPSPEEAELCLSTEEISPELPTLVVTEPGSFGRALRAGARGVLAPEMTLGQLEAALGALAEGLTVLADAATLITPLALAEPDPLTPRELGVLRLLADGMGNKQVAGALSISEHTVKFHITSILHKLHAETRTEAVAIGIRRGWIPI